MDKPANRKDIYIEVAKNLREFGYSDVDSSMIEEIDEARRKRKPIPHGVIGMFAGHQLRELAKLGLLDD